MLRTIAAAALFSLSLVACDSGAAPTDAADVLEDAPKAAPDGPGVAVSVGALRLSANPGAPSAAYLELGGDGQTMTLTSVTSADAERVEMHESRRADGMTSMAELESIVVLPDSEVVMAPGGTHLMVFGISAAARSAGSIRLSLRFADGTVVETTATTANLAAVDGTAAAPTPTPARAAVEQPATVRPAASGPAPTPRDAGVAEPNGPPPAADQPSPAEDHSGH